jgi:RNA polymerase sigma factor (sigma-70 family)
MMKVVSNNFKQLTDQNLIQLFQEGEQRAIGELISRYQNSIYASIYILVKDKFLAEDLFQETFIKIVKNFTLHKYADQGKFLPWALRIAHNLCIDHFRKVKQHIKVTCSDGTDIANLLPSLYTTVDKKIESQQTSQTLQNLLDTLPTEQQEVIIMRVYGELSFKEIAAVTNVSINTALGRMRYGLINLRKMIEEKNLLIR